MNMKEQSSRWSPLHPAAQYVLSELRGRMARARDEDTERGASVVEWIIISAIVVAIVIAVGVVISNALTNSAKTTSDKIQNPGVTGG